MRTDPTPAKPDLEKLLRTGVAAARAGNRSAARALFLALTRAYPNDVRAWLGLAGAAASAQEQREALENVVALDPDHLKARQALASLPPPRPAERATPVLRERATPLLAETVATHTPPAAPAELQDQPPPDDEPAVASRRFPLLNMIALGIIGVLLVTLIVLVSGIVRGADQAAPAPMPSPVLQMADPTTLSQAAAGTPAPIPDATVSATSAPIIAASSTPVAEPSPAASLPAPASLPLGTLIEVDGWSVTLLRPDYAITLDGSIGDLKPVGRFVLALMAISNNSAAPRRIPADLLTLVDNRGRRYSPAPNASTTYLALYERGQHGDLAFEDSLAPNSGMRSVPVLFDVPVDAAGLVLTIRDSGAAGWPIDSAAVPAVNVGP